MTQRRALPYTVFTRPLRCRNISCSSCRPEHLCGSIDACDSLCDGLCLQTACEHAPPACMYSDAHTVALVSGNVFPRPR